jgi:hypothetical protein
MVPMEDAMRDRPVIKDFGISIENIDRIVTFDEPVNGFITQVLMKDMYSYYSKMTARQIVEIING